MSNYSDYFQLKYYHPEITQETFRTDPEGWKATYPHKTFVTLLKRAEKMLARGSEMDKHSIWIHGAYGTGKSQVAWALRKLLTCPDAEFDAYFADYASLKGEKDLRNKLAGHRKAHKIVVATRHGSDAISGPDDLIEAVFESLAKALDDAKVPYDTGATLRGGVAKWLEGNGKEILDLLMRKEPYCRWGSFSGKTADDILATLKSGGLAEDLLKDVRRLAKAEGITALRFSKEDLAAWIRETTEKNNLHLVLVWDEFSAFFKNNKTKLDTLQSLAELSGGTRFNLVIVTHFTTSYLPENDNSARIVVDRFKPTVEISLPENIAFELIGHALKVKPMLQAEWDSKYADDLNDRMKEPRRKVARMLKDVDEEIFRSMLPFHPYAALVLKNIAALFDSNQRSMFTFIADGEDAKAFKWFCNGHSPDNGDVLSVDLLWDYFYETGRNKRGTGETGKSNLDAQVRAILEVFPEKSGKLMEKEKRVLKTILMFQALAKKLNNAPEFLATEENLRLAFEGVEELEGDPGIAIANKLANIDKILFVDDVDGKRVFQAPMATGGHDLQEIEKIKESILQTTKTRELLKEWQRAEVLRLSRPLGERFDVRLASPDSFTQVLNQMLAQDTKNYRMHALVVVGRNDVDAATAGAAIAKGLEDARSVNVVFIDATAEELGEAEFDKWAYFRARGQHFAKKDTGDSGNAYTEAKKILESWRDRIAEGAFTVRTRRNPQGVTCHGVREVWEEMRLSVLEKYPYALEFGKGTGFTDTLFNAADARDVVAGIRGGIARLLPGEKKGRMAEKDENVLLAGIRDVPEYWKEAETMGLPVSKVKAKLEQKTRAAFKSGGEGRISFTEIVETLFDSGFMPTDLHAFMAGFLLKEYVVGDYRFSRDGESVPLTAANLTDGVLSYFKKVLCTAGGRYHEAYIEVLTAEQRRFADLAKAVFKLGENASIDIVAQQLAARIREFQYPLWCFKALPEAVASERYIDRFTLLTNPANQKGATLAGVATEIGKMAEEDKGAETRLSVLFTKEKAQEAMNAWLDEFEGGMFREVSRAINAIDPLADVRHCFGPEGTWLWHQETGEREIRNLLRDYRIVAESAIRGFVTPTNSFADCMEAWRDRTRAVRIPHATLATLRPQSKAFIGLLKEIAQGGQLEQNDRREAFFREITANGDLNRDMLDGCQSLFKATYREQLSGLDEEEIDDLYQKGLDKSSFLSDKPTFEQMLVQKVAEMKSHQGRAKLLALWREKTGSDTPADWSKEFATPILAMVPEGTHLLGDLRKALDAANDKSAPAAKVGEALEFLTLHPEVFAWFDGAKADEAFRLRVVGRYASVLTDLKTVRTRLQRNLGPDVYGWFADPRLDATLKNLAESEYNLHCAEKVRDKIKSMGADEAKRYLVELVVNSLDVGLAILSNG